MVKVIIDENKCIGCGSCEAICPKTYKLINGKATVKKQPSKISCEKEAADSCPVQAIEIK